MKALTYAVLVTVAAMTVLGGAQAQTPPLNREWVEQVEAGNDLAETLRSLALRRGSERRAVGDYARYYRVSEGDGRIVEALFANPMPPVAVFNAPSGTPSAEEIRLSRPGVRLGEPFPMIDDGGCSVVNLSFDHETRRILAARCND